LDLFPWWVGWVSSAITLALGLAMLILGSELLWRAALRSLTRLKTRHWSCPLVLVLGYPDILLRDSGAL